MTRKVAVPDAVALAVLFLLAGLWPEFVHACSLVDVEAAKEESIRISNSYWIGSAVLGAICIAAGYYRGHWIPSLVIVAAVLIFHPRWTMDPLYGPDCAFRNVEASELALALIGVLLSYHLFQIYKARTRSRSSP